MESSTISHPAEQAGQISVIATKDEWIHILAELAGDLMDTHASRNLFNVLEEAGVSYE